MDFNPSIEGEVVWRATDDWSLSAGVVVGFDASNDSTSYYWDLGPEAGWTERTDHDGVELDHYVSIDVRGAYRFAQLQQVAFSALAGFRYTDVKWSAKDGSYVSRAF